MGWRRWVLASCLMFGCGKTSSNDAKTSDGSTGAAGTASATANSTGQGGGASTTAVATTATASVTTTGVALACTYPEDRECTRGCVDVRTDPENCGQCSRACAEGEECTHASCASPLTCEATATDYDIDDMAAGGGAELDDGWALAMGESLSFEHSFQPGPAIVLLTARRLEGEAMPYVTLSIGSTQFEPLLMATTSHAAYSMQYASAGGPELVSISALYAPYFTSGAVAIQGLEVRDCASLNRHCEGGGYYLPELPACAPLECTEASDCHRDFAGQPFMGQCVDGACRYPSCTDETESGLTIAEEHGPPNRLDSRIICYSYSELMFPYSNPRTLALDGEPEDFTCPTVEAITWEVERFAGEGSCSQVPICGPNTPQEFGFEPAPGECCYLASEVCGV